MGVSVVDPAHPSGLPLVVIVAVVLTIVLVILVIAVVILVAVACSWWVEPLLPQQSLTRPLIPQLAFQVPVHHHSA